MKHPTGIDFTHIGDHSEPVLLDFDHATHPVAANGRVYFGSSADDALRCLSLQSGELLWAYVTGGPLRFAPQVVEDFVYVASDDGFVYCLQCRDGTLRWKFRAAPSARQLVGNGRMISRWPLRSGVLVQEDTVYVTAGMWPAEGVYVYALNAHDGTVRWVNDTSGTLNLPTANRGAYAISGVGPTGYLLAGKQALVVPTGRSIPATYALEDGRLLSATAPSYQNRRGGPALCVDPHGSLIFGYPRERLTRKDYSVHYAHQLPKMTQFGTLRADCAVFGERTYVATNDLIRCYDANSRYTKVKVEWQAACPSRKVRCMTLAGNALLLGIDHRVEARDLKTGAVLWQAETPNGFVESIAVVDQQLLVATDSGDVICLASSDAAANPQRAKGPQGDVLSMAKDTKNNARPVSGQSSLLPILRQRISQPGMALVMGEGGLDRAKEIAAATRMEVILLLGDAKRVPQARRELLNAFPPNQGKVRVQDHAAGSPLPFADYGFNLIVSPAGRAVEEAAELLRVLRPVGGTLLAEQSTVRLRNAFENQLAAANATPSKLQPQADANAGSFVYVRGKLPGALDWDSEERSDRRVKWPLELLWFGGPGSKRTGQGSRPPIAAGGRNFVLGKNHLIALDAYNGIELWSRQLPYLYRNIGRLRGAPGPIQPWLAKSINADDKNVWLDFGALVYQLDAATGEQVDVYGEFDQTPRLELRDRLQIKLNHFQQPDARGISSKRQKASKPGGEITLWALDADRLELKLQLGPDVARNERVYWELFLDLRPVHRRHELYSAGVFQIIVWPATGRLENGCGATHPKMELTNSSDGREQTLVLSGLQSICKDATPQDFGFGAALNHPASKRQQAMAFGRAYLRWEYHADALASSLNKGWPRVVRNASPLPARITPRPLDELPEHARQTPRLGKIGKRAGTIVNAGQRQRRHPLSLELGGLQYHRGKGCGYPVSADGLQVLRSGTLAFYDLNDDSGMRYFGGVRPSCTISAIPAQGLVFAAEGSPTCSCNYNFKTTLALAPARHRRHEDWAMFSAPLSPAALLHSGRFNLAAPGDRRDKEGDLWLQFPRAPTSPDRSMPAPVKLLGESMKPYRVNADRTPIANTSRPWLYSSGLEGIEGIALQLLMSDKQGAVVFRDKTPQLDGRLEREAWEARYKIAAGNNSSMLLSHDEQALYIAYDLSSPIDRRGKPIAWKTQAELPFKFAFSESDVAKDEQVWEQDSLEFLVSDNRLASILHFGVDFSGRRYDGLWSQKEKRQDPALGPHWAGAVQVTNKRVVAEFAIPWTTLREAGLDLDNLVIRPRTKKPLIRQPHISHGFRPLLLQESAPKEKRYRVVLHFAELADVQKGERVFDIQVQGQVVLKDFDPVAAADGQKRAVVRQFDSIAARAIDIRLLPHSGKLPPILSAFEIQLID